MKNRSMGTAVFWLGICLAPWLSMAAQNPAESDIRNLKVGVPVTSLSKQGYIHFTCVNNDAGQGKELSGWNDFRQCPPEASGWHEVTFQYDDSQQPWAKVNDKWEGTKISGHPVILSLLIDDTGQVQGIRAVTDPHSPMYLKKKAYLLSLRVKAHYGNDGWTCTRKPPTPDESRVGGMYINEYCEKSYGDRRILLQTELYRASGQSGTEFTNSTRLEILSAKS
jgi:hypothetical protein